VIVASATSAAPHTRPDHSPSAKCATMPTTPTISAPSCQRARRSLHSGRFSTIGISWYDAPMIASVIQPSVSVCVSANTRGW